VGEELDPFWGEDFEGECEITSETPSVHETYLSQWVVSEAIDYQPDELGKGLLILKMG
jgi:hypothetical protein